MKNNWQRIVMIIAGVGLLVALWPPAWSVYGVTGEEALAGQVRGLWHWGQTAVRPQPQLAPQATITPTAETVLGMNTFLQIEVLPEVREETLKMLNEAGFGYIRQHFPWEDIEIHGKGDFIDRRNDPEGVDAWAKYDNIVTLAEQYEIEIIARLDNPPSWTRAEPDEVIGSHGPPDDYNDYGDFVAAVAERYRGRVHYYQLWNEPNIYPEWGERAPDPEGYTALLCEGYRRIKEVDPEAIILAGALSPTLAMTDRHMNNVVYLQRMYQAGASDCFDVFSAQGYGLWSGPTDRRLRPTVINYPHHLLLRDVMVVNGDESKPMWISEMGWNTVPEDLPAQYGRVTAEQQGRYGVEAYERVVREWPWVGVANYWFFKRPGDWEKGESWYYFRLLEPDFTPTEGYGVLAEFGAGGVDVAVRPSWLYGWDRLRPWLFRVSAAVLMFGLLGWLGKGEEMI